MKILIPCLSFNYCSGSALYVYDLSIELTKRGHEVTVLSEIGGELKNTATKQGVRCVDFSNIFEIQDDKFDIIHCNQEQPTSLALEFFEDVPAVMTLHNSLGYEKIIYHPNIKKYIAAKQSEVETFKAVDPIYVPIGIDFERFNTKNKEKMESRKIDMNLPKPVVFFIGTFDKLREKALTHLWNKGKTEGFEVIFVGKQMMEYTPPEAIKCCPETFHIEKWMEASDAVASILLGRTAIEAWACGKDYYCYNVDRDGNVIDVALMPPPEDMSIYDIKHMTDKLLEIYTELI